MKKSRHLNTARLDSIQGAGFSIVEMLIVIAVIGIISAIAIPGISDISKRAKDANIRRNAQNLNSIYASAQSAGYDFAYEDGDNTGELLSEADIIRAIIDGIEISGSGPIIRGKRSGALPIEFRKLTGKRVLFPIRINVYFSQNPPNIETRF